MFTVRRKLFVALTALTVCLSATGCGNKVAPADSTAIAQNGTYDFNDFIRRNVQGDKVEGNPGTTVGYNIHSFMNFSETGLKTDDDVTAEIGSGVITEPITLYSEYGQFSVRVINITADNKPIENSTICQAYLDENSGEYSMATNMIIGQTTYDQVLNYYSERNLYQKGDDYLIYKVNDNNILNSDYSVFPATKEVDGIFSFEGGILKSISLEAPDYLYYELKNNVDPHALEIMDLSELNSIKTKRDNLLMSLEKAFTDAGVDVTMDLDTGLLAMDSDVLFDTDSYALKDSAKEYIDKFFEVYTGIIFDPNIDTEIQSVKFIGHTDSDGDYDYNKTLSENRAKSVLDYCVSDSTMDDNSKERIKSIAISEGHSYDELIYDASGNVDKAASRRVAVDFVIRTDYTGEDENTVDNQTNGELVASATAKGVAANKNYKYIDTDLYSDIANESIQTSDGSPVLFIGDKIELRPGPVGYDGDSRITLEIEDTSIGEAEKVEIEGLNQTFYHFYFEGKKEGKTKVTAYCPNAKDNGTDLEQFVYLRVYNYRETGLPLTLVPNKEEVENGGNIKFTMCGDYEGDVWAFAYVTAVDASFYDQAEWIDPTTLTVDIPESIKEDSNVCVILTPADDLDTILGCARIPIKAN